MSRVRWVLLGHVKWLATRTQRSLTNTGSVLPRATRSIRARGLLRRVRPMKRDHRALSMVRAASPFETPPRVLVMADDTSAGEAVALAEALEELGAEAEVRFGSAKGH